MKNVFKSEDSANYFCGYYDKSPFNIDSSKILACKPEFINRFPEKEDVLEIGFFDWKKSSRFIKITETKAWNWQQGCMLQWLGPDFNSKIIYNDRIKNKFVTVVFDLKNNKKSIFNMSFYSVSSDGDFAICIDNERLCWYRKGYSYSGILNVDKKNKLPTDDGIWNLNLNNNKKRLIINLRDIVDINPLSNMQSATHYLEHIIISPDNKRMAFLHRYKTIDGGIFTRLFTANVDGSEIYLLNDSGRVTHYNWKNNSEIICWGALTNSFNNLRKYKSLIKYFFTPLLPIYKFIARGNSIDGNSKLSAVLTGDIYLVLKDKSKKAMKISSPILNKDGHPSFSKNNNNLLLTDTYPQSKYDFKQELILYDITNDEYLIEKIPHQSEYAFGIARCDLHPKWSMDEKYICIDSLRINRRIEVYEI